MSILLSWLYLLININCSLLIELVNNNSIVHVKEKIKQGQNSIQRRIKENNMVKDI